MQSFVTRYPDFPTLNATFASLTEELLTLTAAGSIANMQLAPLGVVSAVQPLKGKGGRERGEEGGRRDGCLQRSQHETNQVGRMRQGWRSLQVGVHELPVPREEGGRREEGGGRTEEGRGKRGLQEEESVRGRLAGDGVRLPRPPPLPNPLPLFSPRSLGNERAIGHDLLADPKNRDVAMLTIANHSLTLAGPYMLLQVSRGRGSGGRGGRGERDVRGREPVRERGE